MVDMDWDENKGVKPMKWSGSEDAPGTAIPLSELGCIGTIVFIALLAIAKGLRWIP